MPVEPPPTPSFIGYTTILQLHKERTTLTLYKWKRTVTQDVPESGLKPLRMWEFTPPVRSDLKTTTLQKTPSSIKGYVHHLLAQAHKKIPDDRTISVLVSTNDQEKLGKKHYTTLCEAVSKAYYTNGTRFRVELFEPPAEGNGADQFGNYGSDKWCLKVLSDTYKVLKSHAVLHTAWGVMKSYEILHLKNIDYDMCQPVINILNGQHPITLLDNEALRGNLQAAVNTMRQAPGAGDDDKQRLVILLNPRGAVDGLKYPFDEARRNACQMKCLEIRCLPKRLTSLEWNSETEMCRYLTEQTKKIVVFDAGSSGTRLHVYQYPARFNLDRKAQLPGITEIKSVGEKCKTREELGGISKLAEVLKGSGAAALAPADRFKLLSKDLKTYLGEVFEKAEKEIGKDAKRDTRLFLLATGGMRSLKEDDPASFRLVRTAIVDYLNKSGYLNPVYRTISGQDEGLYGWVAANFTTGTFHGSESPRGFMEMGGQTAQIAFVPSPSDRANYGGELVKLKIGEHRYNLFSKTWPKLGADAMWRQHEARLRTNEGVVVHDPCLPKQYSYTLRGDRGLGEEGNRNAPFDDRIDKIVIGTGDLVAATKETFALLECSDGACGAGSICALDPDRRGCLLKDSKGLSFSEGGSAFCGASVFWYATNGVFGVDRKLFGDDSAKKFNVLSFWKEVQDLFSHDWATIQKKRPDQSTTYLWQSFFKAALIMSTLYGGFGVPMPPVAAYQAAKVIDDEVRALLDDEVPQLHGDAALVDKLRPSFAPTATNVFDHLLANNNPVNPNVMAEWDTGLRQAILEITTPVLADKSPMATALRKFKAAAAVRTTPGNPAPLAEVTAQAAVIAAVNTATGIVLQKAVEAAAKVVSRAIAQAAAQVDNYAARDAVRAAIENQDIVAVASQAAAKEAAQTATKAAVKAATGVAKAVVLEAVQAAAGGAEQAMAGDQGTAQVVIHDRFEAALIVAIDALPTVGGPAVAIAITQAIRSATNNVRAAIEAAIEAAATAAAEAAAGDQASRTAKILAQSQALAAANPTVVHRAQAAARAKLANDAAVDIVARLAADKCCKSAVENMVSNWHAMKPHVDQDTAKELAITQAAREVAVEFQARCRFPVPTANQPGADFSPADNIDWTLGKAILEAIGCNPTTRTANGWRDWAEQEEEDGYETDQQNQPDDSEDDSEDHSEDDSGDHHSEDDSDDHHSKDDDPKPGNNKIKAGKKKIVDGKKKTGAGEKDVVVGKKLVEEARKRAKAEKETLRKSIEEAKKKVEEAEKTKQNPQIKEETK